MATNKYFQNVNHRGTQRLTEDLVVESIAMHGIDVYYLPKTLVNRDTLFGSDSLKKFTTAAQVEVYVKDVVGFGGEGDILGKFGLEMRDQVTFTIARRRSEQIKSEKILLETGSNIIFEYAHNLFLFVKLRLASCLILWNLFFYRFLKRKKTFLITLRQGRI